MQKKYIIKNLLKEFHHSTLPNLVRRDYNIPIGSGKIITLIGARRSGKTFLLYQLMSVLTVEITINRLIFVNFEDERLELEAREMDLILQAYLELYPEFQDLSQCYFFFDEIQNISGWEKFIRRIYDTVSKNIFITGSNAKMLSSEIATTLRGRSISYSIYPLSFLEMLTFQNITPKLHTPKTRANIYHALEQYLYSGGFPELQFLPNPDLRRKILQEYYQVMLFRDIVERYQISNIIALKFFLKRLYASTTKQVSINRIYNELKSAGIRTGKNLLYSFLEQAEAIFMVGILKKYAYKISTQELSEKKVYAIDNGLANAVNFNFSSNLGKALEQIIFWELKRRLSELDSLFYYRDNVECDFIIQRDEAIIAAIQVCYSLDDPDTKKREIKGLLQVCKLFELKQGIIISYDSFEDFEVDGINIKVIPAADFLLGHFTLDYS